MPKISQYPQLPALTGQELVLMDSGPATNRQTVTASTNTFSAAIASGIGVFNTAHSGVVPASPGGTATVLRADGAWSATFTGSWTFPTLNSTTITATTGNVATLNSTTVNSTTATVTTGNITTVNATTVNTGTVVATSQVTIGASNAPVFDSVSGNIGYYPRTGTEASAGIMPTNFSYPASAAWVRRYGAVLDGVTNDRAALVAINAIASLNSSTNIVTVWIDGPMAIATSITLPSNVQLQFVNGGCFVVATGQTVSLNGTILPTTGFIFRNCLAGQGTLALSTGKQRELLFEWWGALGNSVADDSAPMVACLAQASNAQATIRLLGNYAFATALTIPTEVEMVGFGKDFGTQLTPTGSANINFTGSSFKCALRRTVIESGQTTAVSTVVVSGAAYNITFEDVFVHTMNGQPTNVCGFNLTSCQDVTLSRVTVYGNGGINSDCIIVGNDARVHIISPDVEASTRGIQVTGNAQCDIISPYSERCSQYNFYIQRSGTAGQCTIVGGDFEVSINAVGIGVPVSSSNIMIVSPNFVLGSGAQGVQPIGSGALTNVMVVGVLAANISDTGNVLSKVNSVAPLAGIGTPTGGSIAANFSGAAATLPQTSAAVAQILLTLKAFGLYAT